MNPLRIRGEGYGRFDRFDVALPEGMVAIVGPNGAGKSRLLGTIELALFAGRGELAQWLAPGAERLLLELVFEHAGVTYKVRRTYQGGSRSRQSVDFERIGNVGVDVLEWKPLTREDAKATDALICQCIGITRATFNASAFLAQGDTGNFADATPALRKAIIGEILDPHNLWPTLAKQASTDASETEKALQLLFAQTAEREQRLAGWDQLEWQVGNYADEEEAARHELEAAERALEEAQQALVDNAAAAERVKGLTAARAHAQTIQLQAHRDRAAAHDAANRLADSEIKLAALTAQVARIPEVETKLERQRELRAEVALAEQQKHQAIASAAGFVATAERIATEGDALAEQHRMLAERHAHLKTAVVGICDRCEQVLGAEAREAALASMAAELDGLEAAITAKTVAVLEARQLADRARAEAEAIEIPELDGFDYAGEISGLREAERWIASAEPMHKQWRALVEQLPALEQAAEQADAALGAAMRELAEALETAPAAADLARAVEDARNTVANARAIVDAAMHGLVLARQQLDQLRDVKQELTGFLLKRQENQARLHALKLAAAWFGRDGIPALIAENAIPAIETKANEILELMPTAKGETLRVELRTQRELKSADHLRETLDILALDAHGARPYETYSGGEKGRLNVALRLALAQLLAHRRGAESRVLCLDEVEYLDQLGQEQLVDVVGTIRDAYDRVLVVSHAAGVRDAFETVIEIASDQDGVSYIVSDSTPRHDEGNGDSGGRVQELRPAAAPGAAA